MIVKNINGTGKNTCKCVSWFEHWKKFSGQSIVYCPVSGCTQKAEVGAHIQKANSTDEAWYIVPLCQGHNKSVGELDVCSVKPVSANVKETCGK